MSVAPSSPPVNGVTVDPYVAQEMGRAAYDVQNVDWNAAAWDRVPALRNLSQLSDLSRLDMNIPPKDGMSQLMAGGTIGLTPGRNKDAEEANHVASDAATSAITAAIVETSPTTQEAASELAAQLREDSNPDGMVVSDDAEVPVLHPAAEKLLELSPEGRKVDRAKFLRVNQAVDLKEVESVDEMCVKERVPERLSRTILSMKQLLGLSDLTTQDDEQFMDLVGAIADSNSEDKSIVQLMLKSGVKYNTTSLSHLSDQRRHHTTYPNRGFHESDISQYPNMARWEETKPSIHAESDRQTWQQRHIDIGVGFEDADQLEAYQDTLTSVEGRLAAVMERLEAFTSTGSPYRERALHPEREESVSTNGSAETSPPEEAPKVEEPES